MAAITRIHLSKTIFQDNLIWKHSINGRFTVKSAYYTARKILRKDIHQAQQRKSVWKIIWQVKIMPKIKYFIWRLLNGFLLVGMELTRKGIQTNNICPICGEDDESLYHVFFECRLSFVIWEN